MPLPAILAGAGALASAAGGIAGGIAAGDARAAQQRLLERAMAEYGRIDLPTLERVAAEELGTSAQEGVRGQMDPRLRGEQMNTLEALKQLSDGGGENAETRAIMSRILGDVARQEGAGRNAILNNMRARGVSGSGSELAMQLHNQQASADRAQDAGLQQGAAAQKRMLDSILQRGRMAGDMRQQDYGELSDAARARDAISRYNADSRTRAKYYNSGLNQQNFENQYKLTQGKANAAAGVANSYGQSADRTAAMGAGIGSGAGQVFSGIGSEMQRSQDRDEDRAFYKDLYGGK